MTAKRPTIASPPVPASVPSEEHSTKRLKLDSGRAVASNIEGIHSSENTQNLNIAPLEAFPASNAQVISMVKSWKQLYAERLVVARNWRKPNFRSINLIGHTDSVMTMYYCQNKNLLITGSSDNTIRSWNTTNGTCLAILKGHTACIRGVQCDDVKIISCSMDKTIRIWNLRTWECVRVIEGLIFILFKGILLE